MTKRYHEIRFRRVGQSARRSEKLGVQRRPSTSFNTINTSLVSDSPPRLALSPSSAELSTMADVKDAKIQEGKRSDLGSQLVP